VKRLDNNGIVAGNTLPAYSGTSPRSCASSSSRVLFAVGGSGARIPRGNSGTKIELQVGGRLALSIAGICRFSGLLLVKAQHVISRTVFALENAPKSFESKKSLCAVSDESVAACPVMRVVFKSFSTGRAEYADCPCRLADCASPRREAATAGYRE